MKSRIVEIIALGIVALVILASNTTSLAYDKKAAGYPATAYPKSLGTADGYVVESGEFTNVGGARNITSNTFIVGDTYQNRQQRGFLHFNTGTVLPDNAIIKSATLKIQMSIIKGTNPFTTHGNLLVDIATPYFGTGAGLALSDFQAIGKKNAVAKFGTTSFGGWYSATFVGGLGYISRTGTTQLRLRFAKDDNNDFGTDSVAFFSGNNPFSAYAPVLIIVYDMP